MLAAISESIAGDGRAARCFATATDVRPRFTGNGDQS
jgi:hypothetical protein